VPTRQVNLADPDFEPTDEELRELSRAAFADVAEENAAALARMNAFIEGERKKAVALIQVKFQAKPKR
jgi:hypothetical protein